MINSVNGPLSGLRHRLFANMRAHLLARVGEVVVAALLLPYVIGLLGKESYGFFSWLLVLSGYVSFADFGLAQGNVRPLARALGEGDHRGIAKILTSAVLFNAAVVSGVAALVALAFWLSRGSAASSPETHSTACLTLLIVAQGVSVAGFPFGSLISATQRLDLIHKIRIAQITLQAAGTVWILKSGGGVLSLCWLQLALAAFQTVARGVISLRLVPDLRPMMPRLKEVVAGVTIGAPLLLLSAHVAVILSSERAMLGFLVDFASLTQYAVASRLVMVGLELPQIVIYSAIPATAALDVLGREGAIDRLYARAFKIAAGLVLPTIATIWVTVPALLHAWLGDGFAPAASIARPLAAGFLLPALTAPAINVLIGRSRLGRAYLLFGAWSASFLMANAAWLSVVGFPGAGWATLALNLLGTAGFLGWFHAHELRPSWPVGSLLARIAGGTLLGMLLAQAVMWTARMAEATPSRSADFLTAVLAGAGLWIGYLGWAWLSGLLDAEDRALVAEALRPLPQR